MSDEERKELFTHKVLAGSRTYFFDVKEAKDGTRYVVISESRQAGSSYEHNRVMVFEENLGAFAEGFQKVLEFLGVKTKSYNLDEIRRKYRKAYERWTPEEDMALRAKYREGVEIQELAVYFERQPTAIRSRLAKLGLLPTEENQGKRDFHEVTGG